MYVVLPQHKADIISYLSGFSHQCLRLQYTFLTKHRTGIWKSWVTDSMQNGGEKKQAKPNQNNNKTTQKTYQPNKQKAQQICIGTYQ